MKAWNYLILVRHDQCPSKKNGHHLDARHLKSNQSEMV